MQSAGSPFIFRILFLGRAKREYDDAHTPAMRILFGNKPSDSEDNTTNTTKTAHD